MKEYDPVANRAIIEYEDAALNIDADLLDDFPYPKGKLLECIGELRQVTEDADDVKGMLLSERQLQQQGQTVLSVRIVRDMDTLDMKLFERAGQYKRQYEEKMAAMNKEF